MNDIKDFGSYSVKNVKSFMGREGYGFNCSLYRDGKKVGSCIDDASGGEMYGIDWDAKVDRKEEQRLLDCHIKGLPKVKSSFGDGKMTLTIDEGWFVTELVNLFEKEKEIRKIRRQCLTKTLVRKADMKKGSYSIYNGRYQENFAKLLREKHGEDVEIFNEVFAAGKIPSVLA